MLLVADRKEIVTLGYRPSSNLLECKLNSFTSSRTVFVLLNLSISDRGEVGFQSSSNALNTHNFNIQEDL